MGGSRLFDVAGDRVRILIDAAATGGALGIIEVEIAPGGGPPPHEHSREDETFHVLSGEVVCTIDGERHLVRAGGAVFAPRGIPHTFRNDARAMARMLVVLTPGGFEAFFAEIGMPAEPGRPIAVPTPDSLARLMEVAPRYGLTFVPPAR
jgi:quercetin dioxygenase-like cupin family protein